MASFHNWSLPGFWARNFLVHVVPVVLLGGWVKLGRAEIFGYTKKLQRLDLICRTFTAFGYKLEFEELLPYIPTLGYQRQVFEIMEEHNINIPSTYMIERIYPISVFVRQMWKRACPVVYGFVPDARHGETARRILFKAKRSIRIIQRFARYRFKTKAAKKIQRVWRKCVSDPSYSVARRRLVREFEEMEMLRLTDYGYGYGYHNGRPALPISSKNVTT
jgi:hypothetical protein